MNPLATRWSTDPEFKALYERMLVSRDTEGKNLWYDTSPQAIHTARGDMAADFRHVNIDGRRFEAQPLGFVLDYSSARHCSFEDTSLQCASLQYCDFTGSTFHRAQMSPIYARGAVFADCVFRSSYLMGVSPTNEKAGFSDLRDCDFTRAQLTRTGLDRCDFSGANLQGAQFVDCEFYQADLRNADLSAARFENCTFSRARLRDTAQVRALLEKGKNQEIDEIQWEK